MEYKDFLEFYVRCIDQIRSNKDFTLSYSTDKGFYVRSKVPFKSGEIVEPDIKDKVVYFSRCDYQLCRLIYRYFWNWKGSFRFGILRTGLASIANSSPYSSHINCKYKTGDIVAVKDINPGDELILDYSHYGQNFMDNYVYFRKTDLDLEFGKWQYELARKLNIGVN